VSSRTDQLQDRLALVTGAAGGLGSALVRSLSQRGTAVVACDVDTASLGRLESGRVHPWRMDLSDPEDIQRSLQAITAKHGDVDILIHAAVRHFAGDDGNEPRDFVNHSPSQVLETLAVAVTGPTLLTQLVCKRMIERRFGRIVLTGSMHRTGTAGLVMYSAAKAYINALARGLFFELREYDVITSVANPGGMHTALHRHRYPWMLDPAVVADTIVEYLALPGGVAVLSFEMVPHHPEHPDTF
jgi:NAD(P)-dependent dehydrogenase (short-subunit alcohol dehydrogenase family)